MTEFSPREIVSELDRFVVGHNEAKRAVAVALRNRWRRRRTPEGLQDEITPKTKVWREGMPYWNTVPGWMRLL